MAAVSFSAEDLSALLTGSRERNERNGITGMLLYKDGYFMQAFEGEWPSVSKLRSRIEFDPRHRGIVILLDGPIVHREFPNWSMGFQHLDAPAARNHPAFSDLLGAPLNDRRFSTDPSLAKRLLLSFAAHSG